MLRFLSGRPLMRMLAVAIATLAIAVGATVVIVNRGPLPTILAQKGIAILEKRYSAQIEMERARFAGPLRLVLYNVTVTAPQMPLIDGPLHAEQVQLDFSLMSVLRGQHLAGLESVHLIAPQIQLNYSNYLQLVQGTSGTRHSWRNPAGAGVSSQAGNLPLSKRSAKTAESGKTSALPRLPRLALLVRDGKLSFTGQGAPGSVHIDLAAYGAGDTLKITRLAMREGAGELQATGTIARTGALSAKVSMKDWLAMDLLEWYPAFSGKGRGTLSAQVALAGTWDQPLVSGLVGLHDARLAVPGAKGTQYLTFPQATARFTGIAGGINLTTLAINTPTGQITGRGDITGRRVNVQLTANNLALPTDIPWLSAWGVAGKAAFTGTLTGPLAQPALDGQVALRQGQLWHQKVDNAQGQLHLDAAEFRFRQVQVAKANSRYLLQGELTGLGTAKQALQVQLDSRSGRVEDLLAVLAIPIDAKGRLDGQLRFGGPFTNVVTAGQVTVHNASLYGERLDWAQGGFRWGDGRLELDKVNGRVGNGQLLLTGSAALDGSALQMDVEAHDWPVDQVTHLQKLVPGWQGALSWTGTLRGSVAQPEMRGNLLAKQLRMGKAVVTRVEGPISIDAGNLQTTGLLARTPNGGSWQLTGQVRNVLTKPELDIDLDVADESLSALLAMGGYRIPAALFDGVVHGTVLVNGPVNDPETRLQLRLADRGLADRNALQLSLRIADRRVSILRVGA